MSVYDPRPLSRTEPVLAGAAALGLAGAVAGCSNDGRGGAGRANDAASRVEVRPAYVRYDRRRSRTWPAPSTTSRTRSTATRPTRCRRSREPPGDGKPIKVMTYTNTPIPPKLEQNPFWQEFNKRVGSPAAGQPDAVGRLRPEVRHRGRRRQPLGDSS